jgi:hypothetical protein
VARRAHTASAVSAARPATEPGANLATCVYHTGGSGWLSKCGRGVARPSEMSDVPVLGKHVGDAVCGLYAFGPPVMILCDAVGRRPPERFLEQRERLPLLADPATSPERRAQVAVWLAEPIPPAP